MTADEAGAEFGLVDVSVRLDGAGQHGAAVVGLEHDVVHVERGVLQVEVLTAAAGEVHHGLAGGAAPQRLVAAVQFGVGLLQQRRPELIFVIGFHIE